jgi:hypothetical protein
MWQQIDLFRSGWRRPSRSANFAVLHCGICGFSGGDQARGSWGAQSGKGKDYAGNCAKMISTGSNPMDHEPLAKDKKRRTHFDKQSTWSKNDFFLTERSRYV